MMTIPLRNSTDVTVVDDVDYSCMELYKYAWFKNNTGVCANMKIVGRKTRLIYLHRLLLGLKKGDGLEADHINRNNLDNQRANLRVATKKQNSYNRKARSKSGYKGVSYHRDVRKWNACIKKDGKQTHLGSFLTAKEAAVAYNNAALRLHGEFAALNTI